MTIPHLDSSVVVFVVAITATLLVVERGREDSKRVASESLSEQRLNRWLIGLSAGATANSGFVVTGAVGLGYTFGAQWLLLPLAWMLGDIVFWSVFPKRINAAGATTGAVTMTDVIAYGMAPKAQRYLRRILGIISLVCLGGYVSAQWLAGQKFLRGAFGFSDLLSLVAFALLIVVYTALGGFRGSVYADTFQAAVRIGGTLIASIAITVIASRTPSIFWSNIYSAGPSFLRLFPDHSPLLALFAICGFAFASLGFGLGQPQIVTRYLAGSDPNETRAAWWIYIGFVQFTWLAMTIFGMALRGVMPHLSDPEMGLSMFHHANTGPFITGIISADIFATIAAASNSLLVAMSQIASRDILGTFYSQKRGKSVLWPLTAFIGIATMMVSLHLHESVVNLALSSVSIMGAGLAPAMLIRVLNWRQTDSSLICSIFSGTTAALMWKYAGLGAYMNEAAPGIIIALAVNFLVCRIRKPQESREGYRDLESEA